MYISHEYPTQRDWYKGVGNSCCLLNKQQPLSATLVKIKADIAKKTLIATCLVDITVHNTSNKITKEKYSLLWSLHFKAKWDWPHNVLWQQECSHYWKHEKCFLFTRMFCVTEMYLFTFWQSYHLFQGGKQDNCMMFLSAVTTFLMFLHSKLQGVS